MLVRFVDRDHPRPWNKGLLVGQKKPLALDPLPMPGRILTRLAVSPSRLRRKVLEF